MRGKATINFLKLMISKLFFILPYIQNGHVIGKHVSYLDDIDKFSEGGIFVKLIWLNICSSDRQFCLHECLINQSLNRTRTLLNRTTNTLQTLLITCPHFTCQFVFKGMTTVLLVCKAGDPSVVRMLIEIDVPTVEWLGASWR